jgi:penicillin-binding protein 2
MLVVDELKKNDPQLRFVAIMLVVGLFVLLAGLWWVQVVSSRQYQSHLETQAYRTIRLPAVRGKILDREGRVLAENRPAYNLSLYLDDDELGRQFTAEGKRVVKQAQKQAIDAAEKKLGRSLTRSERKQFAFTPEQLEQLHIQGRVAVATRIVAQLSAKMGVALVLNPKKFERAYEEERGLPYPIMPNLTDAQIAHFEENYSPTLGVNVELQSVREYPYDTLAAHVLGYLQKDKDQDPDDEDQAFNYRLPDYRGAMGVEQMFNQELHGHAGSESVLVNNLGYRQPEDVVSQPEPGMNVVLTVDLDIQRAAEKSVATHLPANTHAAVIVMNVHTGDIVAMVSSPAFDPNDFAQGISDEKYAQIQQLDAEKNRATYENYAPGSIFKTVVGLAALENGLNPNELYRVQPNPERPEKGCIYIGRRKIEDTAPPGEYNFQKAFIHSSNAYFVTNGLRAGVENIIRMGNEFHLGESTQLFGRQETRGHFPTFARITSNDWHPGDTANLCIGQGEIAVTPIQMAVMVSAIANGGTILWPRLVERLEPQDPSLGGSVTNYPAGLVRDHLTVHPRNFQILRAAMYADVQSDEGSGRPAAVQGMQICGKTGTAQVQDEHNHTTGWNYWFASFAPFQAPKYTVLVMVQTSNRGSGGTVCGPIAHDIYEEILEKENPAAARVASAHHGKAVD